MKPVSSSLPALQLPLVINSDLSFFSQWKYVDPLGRVGHTTIENWGMIIPTNQHNGVANGKESNGIDSVNGSKANSSEPTTYEGITN